MPDLVNVTLDLMEASFALGVSIALLGLYAALEPYLTRRNRPRSDRQKVGTADPK
jgi:hypothetical protein